jgi:hypothetical protein
MGDMSLGECERTRSTYHAREPTAVNCQNVVPQDLMERWSEGYPLVLRGSKIQGNWGPDYWISRFGQEPVMLENCETGELIPSTVAEFLSTYNTEVLRAGVWKLKVQIAAFMYKN